MAREGRFWRAGGWARAASALLAAWLVASVFLWSHRGAEGFNTLLTGLLAGTVALLAMWAPRLRYANLLAAAWLLVTTPFFRHDVAATAWNDALVSAAILALAFVASPARLVGAGRATA